MRNYFLLAFFSFFALLRPAAQNVPNGGFENWDTNKNGGSEPVGWQSLNDSKFTNLFKVSGHTGESAAKLSVEWSSVLNMNVAPMFFLDGNFAISQRFTALEFYLKGTATGGDYLSVSVGMYKGKTLIGYSIYQMNQSYTGWTQITIPIEYGSGEVPDQCFIGIHIYPVMGSHQGTNYTIDDLALTSSSGSVNPVLLSAATNTAGNVLELTFSKPMADPAGKQNQFTLTRNGGTVAFTSASLKPGDNHTILLSPATPLAAGDVLLISYAAGNISASSGEPLQSFSNLSVSNVTGSAQAASWQLVSSGVTDNLFSVHFASNTSGYVSGANARCLKSTTSGQNWSPVKVPSNADFQAVWAVTPDNVYLGAWDTVYYSNNGGTKWNGSFTNSFTLAVNDLQFLSSSSGFGFMSVSSFIKTTNGGTNWSERTGSGVIEDFSAGHMLDQNTGFAVGGCAHIAKTTNGGNSWSVYEWNNWKDWTCTDIWGVHFATAQKGFAVADSGVVFSTANGGTTWSRKVIAGATDRLNDVFFVSATKGWIVGNNGRIFSTTDGGTTWIPQPMITSNHLNSVFFLNENQGWAVGDNGTILKYGGIPTAALPELHSGSGNLKIFPNPAKGQCTLMWTLPKAGEVYIYLTDIAGRMVRTIEKGLIPGGRHCFTVNLSDIRNGIYFCNLISGNETSCIKLIVNQ